MDRSNTRRQNAPVIPSADITVEEYIKLVLDNRVQQLLDHADHKIEVRPTPRIFQSYLMNFAALYIQ
jgi:hypothetical protein